MDCAPALVREKAGVAAETCFLFVFREDEQSQLFLP
jgi:hypothetical protein